MEVGGWKKGNDGCLRAAKIEDESKRGFSIFSQSHEKNEENILLHSHGLGSFWISPRLIAFNIQPTSHGIATHHNRKEHLFFFLFSRWGQKASNFHHQTFILFTLYCCYITLQIIEILIKISINNEKMNVNTHCIWIPLYLLFHTKNIIIIHSKFIITFFNLSPKTQSTLFSVICSHNFFLFNASYTFTAYIQWISLLWRVLMAFAV